MQFVDIILKGWILLISMAVILTITTLFMLRLILMIKLLSKKKTKTAQIHMHQQLWTESKIDQLQETKAILINLMVL